MKRGFLAMLPLWVGAIPSGIAFGLAARAAGLSALQAQLMSGLAVNAAVQLTFVTLLHTPVYLLLLTVLTLGAELPLLGLAIGRQLRLTWPQRLLVAWLLTDGAYGVAAALGPLELPVLLGAEASMFLGWNLGTALGLLAVHAVPAIAHAAGFVVPLTFLAVLLPLMRSRGAVAAALAAAATALVLGRAAPGGVAVLGAAVAGSAAGAWLA
ncbi:MAG TPA: AzlC family ABC transporter permease [Bacillota bacterium]|nr:AzlC family ABC transporter permease [Bacillota bacterium]